MLHPARCGLLGIDFAPARPTRLPTPRPCSPLLHCLPDSYPQKPTPRFVPSFSARFLQHELRSSGIFDDLLGLGLLPKGPPPLQSSISSSTQPSSAGLTDHAAPSRSTIDRSDGNENTFTSAPGTLASVASLGPHTNLGTGGGIAGGNTRCAGRGAFTTMSISGCGSDAGSAAASGATMRPPRESKRKAAGNSVEQSHADDKSTAGGAPIGGLLDAKNMPKLQPLLKAGMPYKAHQPTLKVPPKGGPSGGGKQQQPGGSSSSFGSAAAPARDAPIGSHAHTSSFDLQSSLVGAATLFETSSDHSNSPVGGREDGGMIEV